MTVYCPDIHLSQIWASPLFHAQYYYCFLSCIQVSQEAGQVVWYSHLFKNFPQFVVIHTVKGFGVVEEAEVDIFLEFSCFFHDPTDVCSAISGFSASSKSSLYTWKLWSLAWRILSMVFLACEMSVIVWQFAHSFLLTLCRQRAH